jgi:hypothetical protein
MKYESINREFIDYFPEFTDSYNYFFEENEVTESEYQYIFYEGLVVYIIDILLVMKEHQKRNLLLERLFIFIEKMMTALDENVCNLAYIAFFEYRDSYWFSKLEKYMSANLRDILLTEFPSCSHTSADDTIREAKYTFSDLYGIRDDLLKIFKDDGFKLNDIPLIISYE